MTDAIGSSSSGGKKLMTEERTFGEEGGRGLIIKMSLTPIDDPVSGSGMVHRVLAETLQAEGYDVVVIEANGKPNGLSSTNYRIETIQFDGRESNPYFEKHSELYKDLHPALPFNFPGFTGGLATSSLKFEELNPSQLGSYLMVSGWAFRSAALVYGQPDAVWNGHAWIHNFITGSVPTLFTVHGTASNPLYGAPSLPYRPIVNEGLDKAYKAVPPSDFEFDNITKLGMEARRTQVMPNGYNDKAFKLNEDVGDMLEYRRELIEKRINDIDLEALDPNSKWIIFVGRATYVKGVDLLLEAFAQVLAEQPNTNLIIAGGGDFGKIALGNNEFQNLHSIADQLGIGDRIFFTGSLEQSETALFLDAVDVSVYPSRSESFGLTAVESMAKGVVPVLTGNNGYSYVVDQYEGDPADVARMVPNDDVRLPEVRERAIKRISELTDYSEEIRSVAIKYVEGDPLLGPYDEKVVRSAKELADSILEYVAQQNAIDGIAAGITLELNEDPKKRRERGKIASEFARTNFSITKVVRDSAIPMIEAGIADSAYKSSRWGIVGGERGEIGVKRQERLDAIRMDLDVKRAFARLRDGMGTDQFGKRWRAFNTLVTKYFGHADLKHPIALDAIPDFAAYPNSIFREVARISGVTESEMCEVMAEVEKMPYDQLIKPLPDSVRGLEKGRTGLPAPSRMISK